ncbi:SDR family oxidoreductase [soil metagenome]
MPSVLVTGASRGIGKAIVVRLASDGWDVVAGVRTDADAAAVSAISGVRGILLDVTSEEHVAALADSLPARLDAVVNNAGIAVTQAVLPRLRVSRGRVVFISSVNGKISTPIVGAYCASKFALEATADALRMELRPWRIRVSLVQPAQTATDMWDTAEEMTDQSEAAMTPGQRVLYAKHVAGFRKTIPMSLKMAVPAEKVADVVHRALTSRRPRSRYAVGVGPALQMTLMGNLPTAATDLVLRKVFGQP